MKFDSTGAMLWTRQTGSTADDYAFGIAIDAADNVVLGGYTNGGLDGNTSAGAADAFVAKYDSAGAKLWSRQTGTTGDEFVFGVRVDAAGNVYAAGYTQGGMDGNVGAGGTDIFVFKYSADGTKR